MSKLKKKIYNLITSHKKKENHKVSKHSRNNFAHSPHILCGSYLAVTRKRFHAFAVSLPLYFLKYRILPSIAVIIVVVVVVSTCAALLENAEDTRYFRRTREETPFSSTVSSSCSKSRRRRWRRLLRLSIEAFRTWTGYMVDFSGVLRLLAPPPALRLRIFRNHPRLPSLY